LCCLLLGFVGCVKDPWLCFFEYLVIGEVGRVIWGFLEEEYVAILKERVCSMDEEANLLGGQEENFAGCFILEKEAQLLSLCIVHS
jgi:hypothetical protein